MMSIRKNRKKNSHRAADALDWQEAMDLIEKLKEDARYRDAMFIACGCFLGLRISDILRIRWCDLIGQEELILNEKKTNKERHMKINIELVKHAEYCHEMLGIEDDTSYILSGQMYGNHTPITRQRASQILDNCKKVYHIKSAKVFSTHSLRKTFGRRVYKNECRFGRGDQALLLLQEIFRHSSTAITKRYLGIRQEEINSVYDSLTL